MDKKQFLYDMQMRAYLYRGQIINDFILLERMIDEIMSHILAEKNPNVLFELILGTKKITLENKLQVFKELMRKHHDDFIKENPNIFNDINKLMAERNIVAHCLLDTSEDAVSLFATTYNIQFLLYKNKTIIEVRTQEHYDKFHGITKKYIALLSQFSTE